MRSHPVKKGKGAYLSLRPDVRYVRGPARSALYDLKSKRIWPLDAWMTRLIGNALKGQPLANVLRDLGVRSSRSRQFVSRALSDHPLLVLSARPQESEKPRPASMVRLPVLQDAPVGVQPPSRKDLDFLWLELTERCNLRCVHCYAGSGPGLEDGPMRSGEHLRILREAARAGCRRVQFTGGEALLDPDLPRLIDEAHTLGYRWVEVYSNATLINESRVRFLRDRGVHLAVSFYSHCEETHEAITQVPGSFRRTVEAIRSLITSGVPVRAGIIRMRMNQEDVEPAKDLLVSLGVDRATIGVDEVRPTGRGCGDSLVPAGGQVRMSSPPSGESMQPGANGTMGCQTCWSGKIAVAPSGDVFPCIFSRELGVGNVLRRPLQEVLETASLQDLWSIDKAQIPVCRDCEFRYGCFDCRALAYKQTGQLRSKPPSCAYDPYTGTWEGVPEPDASPAADDRCVPVRSESLSWVRCGELGLLYSRALSALLAVNRVAAEIVGQCNGRRSLDRIARNLARRYRTPEPDVRRDVRQLLTELAGLGLMELRST